MLFLCVLPTTVQSSITFTSMARGNVSAAVCSASASTMLGVFVSPVVANLIVVPRYGVTSSLDSIGRILLQLMVSHQIQLMACALIAQRYARRKVTATGVPVKGGVR